MISDNLARGNSTCFYRQGLLRNKSLLHVGHCDTESQNQVLGINLSFFSFPKAECSTDVMP